jgi:outer membrane protein TolC
MNLMSATEEIAALQKALASAKSELTLVRTERDLLKVSLTAVMEPSMFGVMEPQTVAKTTPRRG